MTSFNRMSDLPARTRHILDSVVANKLKKARAARFLGVSRKTLYKWLQEYVALKEQESKGIKATKGRKGLQKDILSIVTVNPQFGPKRISSKLAERGKKLSVRSVWLVLRRLNLSTSDLRKEYAGKYRKARQAADADFPLHLRLTPETRKRMVEEVLISGRKPGDVCGQFRVSRETFAKWKRRYLAAQKVGENILEALTDAHPEGTKHPRGANKQAVQAVLDLVIENPVLSSHKIAEKLPFIGNHGVQNVLSRNNLNLYEMRLAYSKAQREALVPKPVPVSFLDRIRLVWEQFVPSLAPAPPPEERKRVLIILKAFGASMFASFIFAYGAIYWLNLLTGTSIGRAIGLIFATVALFMGSIFFLYSLKYYITLAIVLSFSQQPSFGKPSEGKGRGILSWILGLGNGNGNGKSRAIGLEPSLEHIKLKRYPVISVHIPLYNEKNVVERLLAAVTSFDYAGDYEVVIADDSTDETTQIIQDYLNSSMQNVESSMREKDSPHATSYQLHTTKGDGWTLTQGEVRPGVIIKHLHRTSRKGFKGGALRLALQYTDPRAEFVSVFDADFVPYPDTLELFLKYFQATAGSLDFKEASRDKRLASREGDSKRFTLNASASQIAAVQGYQWHVLNKSENWITRGVRSEYAGSYVIERSGVEIYSGLKQISGAVYMIRRDVLEEVGWETSITEDFQLTLKLYERGYRVVYTPYIQAPAECVSTLKRLIRQRIRWAEGHSNNVRKMFVRLLFGHWEDQLSVVGSPLSVNSQSVNQLTGQQTTDKQSTENRKLKTDNRKVFIPSPLTLSEKLEFLYLSPYYLQAFFFLIGTFSWLISETIFATRLPFWTSLWGWSLVLTNLLALPLVNAVGLFLEESDERDYQGIASFIALTYIIVPFQAYAALKGFLQKQEGPWFRTPKTGRITDIISRGRFYRLIAGILPGRAASSVQGPASSLNQPNAKFLDAKRYSLNAYLSLATANSRFDSFKIKKKRISWIGKIALVSVLTLSLLVNSMAFTAKPVEATWYSDTNYLYRKALTIDETLVSGSADHSNFPILVSHTDASLKTTANGGRVTNSSGFDIIFTNDDKTTKLDHEIEKYTATTGEIVMWVRIPTLPYNVDKDIYIYYGNSSISSSQENITGVWDANFKGVWHLKEDPSGTAPQMKDSTANANDGTSSGAMTSGDQVGGQVDGSLDFDVVDEDKINAGSGASLDDLASITVEAWVNPRSEGQWSQGRIVDKGSADADANTIGWQFGVGGGGDNRLNFLATYDTTNLIRRTVDNAVTLDIQQHIVLTWDGSATASNVHIYTNGVENSYGTTTNGVTTRESDNANSFNIGNARFSSRTWDGILDEVRISNIVRSIGWFTTGYNNQNNQGTGTGKFIKTLGAEEEVPELIILLLPLAILAPALVKYFTGRKREWAAEVVKN